MQCGYLYLPTCIANILEDITPEPITKKVKKSKEKPKKPKKDRKKKKEKEKGNWFYL